MSRKRDDGLVFSTDPEKMQKLDQTSNEPPQTELSPEQTTVSIQLDTKRRRGKTVTLLTGFQATPQTLKDLGRKLKAACGSGGTTHTNEIEIQGDHRDFLVEHLNTLGYKAVKVGG